MRTRINKLILIVSAIVLGTTVKAQNLIVSLTNGNSETFAVSDITSVKFGATDMILNETSGTTNTWAIDDIDNYSFDGVASTSEMNILEEDVSVFPNPATDKVNIRFNSNQNQQIAIEIVDAAGRLVFTVYQGSHEGESSFVWSPQSQGNAMAGNYFCKITTENKVITQPIIIQ